MLMEKISGFDRGNPGSEDPGFNNVPDLAIAGAIAVARLFRGRGCAGVKTFATRRKLQGNASKFS